MDENKLDEIKEQSRRATKELIAIATPKKGAVFVVGCSSSEIMGAHIGKGSSEAVAQAVYAGIDDALKAHGLALAAQCCEHLNRALIVERETAERLFLEPVNVVPQVKAGGSFATTAYKRMKHPVAVEHIRADLGMDIGDTFIGMHLKSVAVPVRLSVTQIGQAHLTCAKTRLKYIGGSRAMYLE